MVLAIQALSKFVVGKSLSSITSNLGGFYRDITSEPQLRWLGPEKGGKALIYLNIVFLQHIK